MDDNPPVDPTPTPAPEPEADSSATATPLPDAAPETPSAPAEPAPLEAAAPADAAPANPAPSAESAPEQGASAEAPAIEPDAAALSAFVERSASQRLPAADEEKASKLIQAGLLAGKEELANVAAALPKLGWSVAVRGVTAAWPSLKATPRNALIKALSADESESARRIRLSIARGLFKVPDIANSTKLIIGVCKEIRNKDTGEVAPRDAHHFANVMIGKGKPWIAQLPLADLKPADAASVVHCAIVSAFSVNGPPVTPLGVLKWAAEAGQLADLHPSALAVVTKAVARWSAKWAEALRQEVPGAPEAILSALKPPTEAGAAPEKRPAASTEEGLPAELHSPASPEPVADDGLPAALKEPPTSSSIESGAATETEPPKPKERPVYVSRTVPPKEPRQQQPSAPASQHAQQQPQQPQHQGGGKQQTPKSPQFNASEVLRQLESHISWLKGELQTAEKKLRSRDDDRRGRKSKPDVPLIEGEPTPEELARLNIQLEARIAELQARVDDLTADAEARATSAGAFTDGPPPQPDAQLRTLLGLKLREHYEDFVALEQEDRDIVIPQHYRTVLAEVFAVLKAEAVPLEAEPEAPQG